jgi:ubiquinone/menaquinone biosynthesis C-methylase UbiE
MAHRVCPWWIGYLLISPLRRLASSPKKILAPFIHEGQTVLEPGPGMGFFTLELARRVGSSGRVIAIDIQQRMLDGLKRRAAKAGLQDRIDARRNSPNSLGIGDLSGRVDFTLAFAMVHELPDPARFFREVAAASKPGALVLLAEPTGHVSESDFRSELRLASNAGFEFVDRPKIKRSLAAVLKKA